MAHRLSSVGALEIVHVEIFRITTCTKLFSIFHPIDSPRIFHQRVTWTGVVRDDQRLVYENYANKVFV